MTSNLTFKLRYAGAFLALALVAQAFTGFVGSPANAAPAPVHNAPVQVDANCGTSATPASCTTSKLDYANTTRKLGVSSSGTIFALFYGPEGIRVASSLDRGATFAPAVQVSSTNAEAELAVAANDNLYVVWTDATKAYFSRSTDLGLTWSTPVQLAKAAAGTVHMAVDGDYVYMISKSGSNFWVSADGGQTFSSGSSTFGSWAFSDILVDPLTHNVYAFVDNPSVSWFVSTDRGATFSSANATGKSVYYSVSAISSSTTATYMYMAGSMTNLEKVDLMGQSHTVTTLTVSDSSGLSQGRALAADGFGNVISGSVGTSGLLSFQVSNDFGATFGAAQTLLTTGVRSKANVAINQTNGDLMFLYQDGDDIFFQAYSGYLVGYDLALSLSSISLGYAGEVKTLVLTNSGTTILNFTNIGLSNALFTQTTTCTGALAVGSSCTIQITGSTAGDALLNIAATNGSGSVSRTVPVTLGLVATGGSNAAVVCYAPEFDIKDRAAVSVTGQTLKLEGKNLDKVSSVKVAGKSVKVAAQTANEISLELPALDEGMPDFDVAGNCGTHTIQGLIEVFKPYDKVRTQKITLYHYERPTLAGLTAVERVYLKDDSVNVLKCVATLASDASANEESLAIKRISRMCNGVVKYAKHIKAADISINRDAAAGSKTVMYVTFDRTLGGK